MRTTCSASRQIISSDDTKNRRQGTAPVKIFEPSSEIVGQVRPGSMGLTAEQDIMTMEMRLLVFRKPYAILMISLILLLVASMRAFESLCLAVARIPVIFHFIFFLSSRNFGIRHRCAQDIHLRRSSPILSYPAFNASRRSSFSK